LLAFCLSSPVAAAKAEIPEVWNTLRSIESRSARGQGDEARLEYQAQVKNNTRDVLLRLYLAWCSIPSAESWNSLKGWSTIYPENPWLHYGMGRIFAQWKMLDAATASLQAALQYNKDFYPAWVALGDLARHSSDFSQAENHYRRALAIHDDAEGRAGLGLTLVALGRTSQGLEELRRGIELWPDQPEALATLAEAAKRQQDQKTAAYYLAKLLDLRPRDRDGRRTLADLYFEAGDKEPAAAEYERVLKVAPSLEVALRLSRLYADFQRPQDEGRTLQAVLSLDPVNPAPAVRLSELSEARGDFEAAEGLLAEAARRGPQDGAILLRLARLQNRRGKLVGALENYRAAEKLGGASAAEAEKEARELARSLRLPSRPFQGTIESVQGNVSWTLHLFAKDRMKDRLDVDAAMKFRIKVDDGGRAELETLENSLDDGFLYAHTYLALKDAAYAKQRRESIVEFSVRSQTSK
jgi:tetratricopeptide (TPR) repeat protein